MHSASFPTISDLLARPTTARAVRLRGQAVFFWANVVFLAASGLFAAILLARL